MLGFIPKHPLDIASAQVLIQRLPSIALTVQRRKFLPALESSLKPPINGGTISITQKQRVESPRLCRGSLGAAHRLLINGSEFCPACPVFDSEVSQLLRTQPTYSA